MGVCEVLTIVFVVLKLIDKIDWSWGQVLIPMYIGIGLWLITLIFRIIKIIKE